MKKLNLSPTLKDGTIIIFIYMYNINSFLINILFKFRFESGLNTPLFYLTQTPIDLTRKFSLER